MRKRAHIGFSLAEKIREFLSASKNTTDKTTVEKTYEGTDDNFFEATNANLRTILKLDEKPASYEKDLKRFGTRPGLIEVADDAIPKKRQQENPPLKKPYKRKCFNQTYEADLKRFGTLPGVIKVSRDDCKKKPKHYPKDFSKAAYKQVMTKWTTRDTNVWSANPFSEIYRDFPKVQITVRNTSADEKEVILWGASRKTALNPPKPEDVQDHALVGQISVPAGVHPQGMVVNPANQYLYIANQLSGSVTVLDQNNQVRKIIQLEPDFPGFTSPTALAVNTLNTSNRYGYVYVSCSVSNTIAVIDLALNVVAMTPTGVRPIAIAFNPVNACVYTANLVSDNVTVINAETFLEIAGSPLPAGQDPIGIGVHPPSGEVYVCNSLDNSLSVYNHLNASIALVPGVTQYPASVSYNPANNSLYVTATRSNQIHQVNPLTHQATTTLTTGLQPYNAFFDSLNNYLYVQNRGDQTFTIIRPDNSKVDGLSFGLQNIGGVFNSFTNSIYISNTAANSINVIGYLNDSSVLLYSPDYAELREELKNSPAIVQHTKFIVTGPERLNSFRLTKFTPTGRQSSKPVSFELYASPQSRLNVAEVTDLSGTIIDGKMNWQFRLPGLHTVSILIWYRQFEVRDILSPPESKSHT